MNETKSKRDYQRRGGQPNQHFPKQGIGQFNCNYCGKKYTRYGKYDRFCNTCRRNVWTP